MFVTKYTRRRTIRTLHPCIPGLHATYKNSYQVTKGDKSCPGPRRHWWGKPVRNLLPALPNILTYKIPFDSKILLYLYPRRQTSKLPCFRRELQGNCRQEPDTWKTQSWGKQVWSRRRKSNAPRWQKETFLLTKPKNSNSEGQGTDIKTGDQRCRCLFCLYPSASTPAQQTELHGVLLLFGLTHAPTSVTELGGLQSWIWQNKMTDTRSP